MGSSREDIRAFPIDVRENIGYALRQVQAGRKPPQEKKLKGEGMAGVYEIREDGKGGTYRAIYVVSLGEAIYILHAFQKKSKRGIETPKADMDLVRRRLAAAREHVKERRR
jgi:phage-related protein